MAVCTLTATVTADLVLVEGKERNPIVDTYVDADARPRGARNGAPGVRTTPQATGVACMQLMTERAGAARRRVVGAAATAATATRKQPPPAYVGSDMYGARVLRRAVAIDVNGPTMAPAAQRPVAVGAAMSYRRQQQQQPDLRFPSVHARHRHAEEEDDNDDGDERQGRPTPSHVGWNRRGMSRLGQQVSLPPRTRVSTIVTLVIEGRSQTRASGSGSDSTTGVVTIPPDSMVCTHMFCEITCPDGALGCHTCGWGGILLRDAQQAAQTLARGAPLVCTSLLADTGEAPLGARGIVTIEFSPDTADAIRRRIAFSAPAPATAGPPVVFDGNATSGLNAEMRAYDNAASAVFSRYRSVSNAIQLMRAPCVVTCGKRVVRPPCAFVLQRQMPRASEEYYVNALATVLARRRRVAAAVPNLGDTHALLELFANGRTLAPDAEGAVLADVAMYLATACVYLFDTTLDTTGRGLDPNSEEFLTLCNLILCGDCEDEAFLAVSALADILQREDWATPAMRRLHVVRLRYVAGVALKAVDTESFATSAANTTATSTASGAGTGSAARPPTEIPLVAHASCDLIPVLRLADMLAAAAAATEEQQQQHDADTASAAAATMKEIAARRRLNAAENRKLMVVVCEGTYRTLQFDTPDPAPAADDGTIRAAVQVMTAAGIADFAGINTNDLTAPSDFYRYAVSIVLHDTLLHAQAQAEAAGTPTVVEWKAPQVIFATKHRETGKVYAVCAPHSAYVRGDPRVVAFAAPTPTPRQYAIMHHLVKYEHPTLDITAPALDMDSYDKACAAVRAMADRVAQHARAPGAHPSGSPVVVYIPLWVVAHQPTLRALESRIVSMSPVLTITALRFEHVVDGVAFAVLSLDKLM